MVQLACNGGLRHYDYDAFGNELAPNENDDNPLRYNGQYWDEETGTYYLRARQYNPVAGRFTNEDPIRDGYNWYAYCNNNPVMLVDPSGLEDIVVSGGLYRKGGNSFDYNFIEPAIKALRESDDPSNTTWIIVNEGWTDEDRANFKSVADDIGVKLIYIENTSMLIDYINNKDGGQSRYYDPITKFDVFSHGIPGELMLGFNYLEDNDHLDFKQSDIDNLYSFAFQNTRSTFYSCNTGTGDNSFAQAWTNKTKGISYAFSGQTEYTFMSLGHNLFEKLKVKVGRFNTGFMSNGSLHYPVASENAVGRWFYEK